MTKIKNSFLSAALMLGSCLTTVPVNAQPPEKAERVKEAQSKLTELKKAIKCAWSGKGCTRQERAKIIAEGVGLLAVILILIKATPRYTWGYSRPEGGEDAAMNSFLANNQETLSSFEKSHQQVTFIERGLKLDGSRKELRQLTDLEREYFGVKGYLDWQQEMARKASQRQEKKEDLESRLNSISENMRRSRYRDLSLEKLESEARELLRKDNLEDAEKKINKIEQEMRKK